MNIVEISGEQTAWDVMFVVDKELEVIEGSVAVNALDSYWRHTIEKSTKSKVPITIEALLEQDGHLIRANIQSQLSPLYAEMNINPLKAGELIHQEPVAGMVMSLQMLQAIGKAFNHYSARTKDDISNGASTPPVIRACEGASAGLMFRQIAEIVPIENVVSLPFGFRINS